MLPISDEQFRIQFAVMVIEAAAKLLGIEPQDMWRRLDRLDMVNGYILRFFDTLHTESLRHTAERVVNVMHNREQKGGTA